MADVQKGSTLMHIAVGIPELLAGLLNLALIGILVEAAFGLLERHTVVRWGMKTRT
jgi:ABC-type nitrate/sulfonate/bicarbonate transport system permease component